MSESANVSILVRLRNTWITYGTFIFFLHVNIRQTWIKNKIHNNKRFSGNTSKYLDN